MRKKHDVINPTGRVIYLLQNATDPTEKAYAM